LSRNVNSFDECLRHKKEIKNDKGIKAKSKKQNYIKANEITALKTTAIKDK
jgi:hypothetical protein